MKIELRVKDNVKTTWAQLIFGGLKTCYLYVNAILALALGLATHASAANNNALHFESSTQFVAAGTLQDNRCLMDSQARVNKVRMNRRLAECSIGSAFERGFSTINRDARCHQCHELVCLIGIICARSSRAEQTIQHASPRATRISHYLSNQ